MPAEQRPTDVITQNNLLIGMPFVEFGPVIGGVQQPLQLFGIVDSFELAKELDELALESSQSGSRVTIRELITRIDPEFNIGLFNFAAEIMQFTMGSASLVQVTADAAAVVTDEEAVTTSDPEDFLDLAQRLLNAGSVVVTPAAVDDEQIGTSDGTLGATSGDFSLDFKVRLVADVTRLETVTPGGVITAFTPIAVGAAAAGNEVEVVVGTGSDSGDLQFFVGGVATDVANDDRVEGDYAPSFPLVEGPPDNAITAVDDARSDDGTVFTDETADANSGTLDDVTLTPAVPAVADAFYVGMQDGRFDRVRFNISAGQEGVDYTVIWEYSQGGGAFAALSNVTDPTNGFLNSGLALDVTFDVPTDWVPDTVDSVEAHYIRARVATIGTPTGATGTQIWTANANDYVTDLKGGRLQVHTEALKSTGARPLIAAQPVDVDYTYNRLARSDLSPFTQTTFAGIARIRHLTDVGINFIWDIPSAQINVTGDALAFSDEDFTVGTVVIKVLDAGGSARFGTLQHFSEPQAAA